MAALVGQPRAGVVSPAESTRNGRTGPAPAARPSRPADRRTGQARPDPAGGDLGVVVQELEKTAAGRGDTRIGRGQKPAFRSSRTRRTQDMRASQAAVPSVEPSSATITSPVDVRGQVPPRSPGRFPAAPGRCRSGSRPSRAARQSSPPVERTAPARCLPARDRPHGSCPTRHAGPS